MAKNTRTGSVIQYEVKQEAKSARIQEAQARISHLTAIILRRERERVAYSNTVTAELKPLKQEVAMLIPLSEEGVEIVEVDARQHFDYDSNTVKVIQEGTKKVLNVREMTEDEKANPELPDMEPGVDGEPEEAAAATNGASKKAASKTRRVKADATGKPRQRRARAEA